MNLSETLWSITDRIIAGSRALTTQLPKIAADPRSYPRESMLLAAVAALILMIAVLAFFAIADSVNAAAARRRLGFDPRRARRIYLMQLFLLVVLLVLPLLTLAPYTSWGSKPCGSCHEISAVVDRWENGPHSNTGCWGCHSSGGMLGALEATARDVVRMAGRGGGSATIMIQTSRCLVCHEDVAREPIRVNRLRVSHAEMIDAGMDCLLCHRRTGHDDPAKTATLAAARGRAPVERSTMSRCLVCHDNRTASSECEVCHVDSPLDKAVTASADARTPLIPRCKGCHKTETDEQCIECHGLELPHPQPAFMRQHAGISNDDPALCARCHESASPFKGCGCHSEPNLHGTYSEWFPIHGTSALAVNNGAGCQCHEQGFCGNCHDDVVLRQVGP